MPTGKSIPASPDQIARFGHIAAVVRKAMQRLELSPAEFNQRIGLKRSHSVIYNVLNSKKTIGPSYLSYYSEVLGIPMQDLLPRDLDELVPAPEKPRTAVAVIPAPVTKGRDVLNFAVEEDGRARLRLDLIASIETVTPVLRMLLDMGLVIRPRSEIIE